MPCGLVLLKDEAYAAIKDHLLATEGRPVERKDATRAAPTRRVSRPAPDDDLFEQKTPAARDGFGPLRAPRNER